MVRWPRLRLGRRALDLGWGLGVGRWALDVGRWALGFGPHHVSRCVSLPALFLALISSDLEVSSGARQMWCFFGWPQREHLYTG